MNWKNLVAGAVILMTMPSAAMAQREAPRDRISSDRAVDIAIDEFGGRATRKPALDYDNGRWRYDVHLIERDGDFRVVSVDARTGRIFNTWISTADKEREKDWREFRETKSELVASRVYRDFRSRPSATTARRLVRSQVYKDYVHMYRKNDADEWQRDPSRNERRFYNDLMVRLRKYLGKDFDDDGDQDFRIDNNGKRRGKGGKGG